MLCLFTSEEEKKKKKASFLAGPSIGEQKVFYRGNKWFFSSVLQYMGQNKIDPSVFFSILGIFMSNFQIVWLWRQFSTPSRDDAALCLRPKKDSLFFPLETPQEEIKGKTGMAQIFDRLLLQHPNSTCAPQSFYVVQCTVVSQTKKSEKNLGWKKKKKGGKEFSVCSMGGGG